MSEGTEHSRARKRRQSANTSQAPRLRDVACAAGVSTATASRALTRPEVVSEGVRARVLLAANRLGYTGNIAARFLSARRSGLIGAVVSATLDPIGWEVLRGVESALVAKGVGLLLQFASGAAFAQGARALVARGVDGILLIGSLPGQLSEAGALPGVPWIECGRRLATGGSPSDEGGADGTLRLAVAYLEQLGHRRIGLLAGSGMGAMVLSQPETVAESIVYAVGPPDGSDAVRAGVEELVACGTTAIIAGTDSAAAVAIHECRALSLAVPGQQSIIGWGDTGLARSLDPPLTSMRVPAHASGRAAAEHLMAAIAGREFSWPEMPVKLVVRRSTAPPGG